MDDNTFDVVVIGAGPIGLFALFQAGILGMKAAVIETLPNYGGQCTALYPEKPIYDIPGHPIILAKDLIDNLFKSAEPFGPKYFLDQTALTIEETKYGFSVTTSCNNIIKAKVILISAGCGSFVPNKPLVNLEEYENKSVFYNVKNINELRNKRIIIAGGGDSAVDFAIILSNIANVTVIHRREKFRAAEASVNKMYELHSQKKLNVMVPYQLSSINGKEGYITEVTLKHSNGQLEKIQADVLLSFFGLKMDLSNIMNWDLEIKGGKIMVDRFAQTTRKGIYACGDVATYEGKIKLILTGFAEVSMALYHSYNRVFGKEMHFQYSTSIGIPN